MGTTFHEGGTILWEKSTHWQVQWRKESFRPDRVLISFYSLFHWTVCWYLWNAHLKQWQRVRFVFIVVHKFCLNCNNQSSIVSIYLQNSCLGVWQVGFWIANRSQHLGWLKEFLLEGNETGHFCLTKYLFFMATHNVWMLYVCPANRWHFVQYQCAGTLSLMKVSSLIFQTWLLFALSSLCLRSANFVSWSSADVALICWLFLEKKFTLNYLSYVCITMLLFWVSFRCCISPGVLKTNCVSWLEGRAICVCSPGDVMMQFVQSWIWLFEKEDMGHRPVSCAGWVLLE